MKTEETEQRLYEDPPGEGAEEERPEPVEAIEGEELPPEDEEKPQRKKRSLSRNKNLQRELEALEEDLAKAREAEAETRNRWLRSAAEFENFRKRSQREKAELIRTAGESVLAKLLDVLDAMDAAQSAARDLAGEAAVERLLEGVAHIHTKLTKVLESEGVSAIAASPGEGFDPRVHEALAQLPSAELPANSIHSVIQTGYSLGEKVLRPARVAVAIEMPGAPAEETPVAGQAADESPLEDQSGENGAS